MKNTHSNTLFCLWMVGRGARGDGRGRGKDKRQNMLFSFTQKQILFSCEAAVAVATGTFITPSVCVSDGCSEAASVPT